MCPWALDGSKHDRSADFDALEPRLSRCSLPPDARASFFVEVMSTDVLASLINLGPDDTTDLFDIGNHIVDAVEAQQEVCNAPLETPVMELKDFTISLKVLATPNPTEAPALDPKKRARYILSGGVLCDGVQVLVDGISQNEGWDKLRKDYKVSILHEMTIAPQMSKLIEKLSSHEDGAAQECLDKLGHWHKTVRVGGASAVEKALVADFEHKVGILERPLLDNAVTQEHIDQARLLSHMLREASKHLMNCERALKDNVSRLQAKAKELCTKLADAQHTSSACAIAQAFMGSSRDSQALADLQAGLGDSTSVVNDPKSLSLLTSCLDACFGMVAPLVQLSEGLRGEQAAFDAIDRLLHIMPKCAGGAIQRITAVRRFYKLIFDC